MNWLKRLFKREKYEEFSFEPLYTPGELVVVFNPYVLDGMISDEIRPPRVAMVERCAFVSNIGVFAYQLENDSEWYTETWLFPAVYGTETIAIEIPKNPSNRQCIDDLLDEYNDYKALADSLGDEEYCDKLAEIKKHLKDLMITEG